MLLWGLSVMVEYLFKRFSFYLSSEVICTWVAASCTVSYSTNKNTFVQTLVKVVCMQHTSLFVVKDEEYVLMHLYCIQICYV